MHPKTAISFPHMGDYSVVFTQLFRQLFPAANVTAAPPITRRTLELGSRYSPDFVCSPFKYNLGNYIEALENGANLLFQTGMGCRYGYYGELQEQILRDLGYNFRFACLSRERAKPRAALRILRELGCTLPSGDILRALALAAESIRVTDRADRHMRENIGFEGIPGSFESARAELLRMVGKAGSLRDLAAIKKAAAKIFSLPVQKPEHPLRVGIVGELFTLMEPHSNFHLEKILAGEGIAVSRAMGVWFLLSKNNARSLRRAGNYLACPVGANGVDSVSQSLDYARRGYDGVLHIHSFGCIPELSATPALINLSRDTGVPILHMSFDTHTSETGILTRLEAFADMIRMKRDDKDG